MDDYSFKTIKNSNAASGGADVASKNDYDAPTIKPDEASTFGPKVGDKLAGGRYEILSELGRGGMGIVYRCFDSVSGIEVALKALPPELSHNLMEMKDVRENFQLVANLGHQNIAGYRTLEQDTKTGDYFLIMELVSGENLRQWMKRMHRERGVMTLDDALPILRQVAEALDYAHDMKVMHRDIKPANIMVTSDGQVKVMDFGLAAQIHTSLSNVTGEFHGTSGTKSYMSPEQWRAKPQGAAADQYALAVMAYEMLTGHLPFESSDTDVLKKAVLEDPADSVEGLDASANRAMQRALAKNPAERFASCVDFVDALSGARIRLSSSGKSYSRRIIAGLVFVALLAGVFFYMRQRNGTVNDLLDSVASLVNGNSPTIASKPAEPPQAEKRKTEKQPVEMPSDKGAMEEPPASELEEDILKQQQETNKLKNELHSRLRGLNKVIESNDFDRGQTFGVHLDTLKSSMDSAEKALKDTANDKRFAFALEQYQAALDEATWINMNLELRKVTRNLFLSVEAEQKKADEKNGGVLAISDYKPAADNLDSARKSYDAGDFTNAISALNKAEEGFANAAKNAYAADIQSHLNSGRFALEGKRWDDAASDADYILRQEPDNDAARNLLAEAQAGKRQQRIDTHLTAGKTTQNKPQPAQNTDLTADKHIVVSGDNIWMIARKYNVKEKDIWQWNNLKSSELRIGQVLIVSKPSNAQKTINEGDGEDAKREADEVLKEKPGKAEATRLKANAENDKKTENTFREILDLSGVQLKIIKVKAGRFQMGSPENELGRDDSEKQHWVVLTQDYWLGETEVTQGQWKAVMEDNPSVFKKGNNYPVENVSWKDAMEFCDKLNWKYNGSLPRGYKFSLPTEAQWEYACRAGTTTALNHGKDLYDEKNNCPNLNEVGWYAYKNDKNTGGPTHPVAQKRQNTWGFYDMHGNVWEWCNDWYGNYIGDATDPKGPSNGSERVGRGGSWYDNARYCRAACRGNDSPTYRGSHLGFRLALVPVSLGDSTIGTKHTLLEKIKQAGKIVVYTYPEFPPYEYLNKDGKIVGSEIDLVNRIAGKLGVKAEFVNSEFDTILMDVVTGKADIGASGFTITDERKKVIDFSKPFVRNHQYLIVPKASSIKVVEDLAGKKIGGQLGTAGLIMVEDAVNNGVLRGMKIETKAYNTAPDAVIVLKAGRLDAVVIDDLNAKILIAKNPGLKCFEMLKADGTRLEEPEEFGIMVAKGNEDLLAIINSVIDEMKADGSLDASLNAHQEASMKADW